MIQYRRVSVSSAQQGEIQTMDMGGIGITPYLSAKYVSDLQVVANHLLTN
jgi:hypothetical protein